MAERNKERNQVDDRDEDEIQTIADIEETPVVYETLSPKNDNDDGQTEDKNLKTLTDIFGAHLQDPSVTAQEVYDFLGLAVDESQKRMKLKADARAQGMTEKMRLIISDAIKSKGMLDREKQQEMDDQLYIQLMKKAAETATRELQALKLGARSGGDPQDLQAGRPLPPVRQKVKTERLMREGPRVFRGNELIAELSDGTNGEVLWHQPMHELTTQEVAETLTGLLTDAKTEHQRNLQMLADAEEQIKAIHANFRVGDIPFVNVEIDGFWWQGLTLHHPAEVEGKALLLVPVSI